LHVGAETDSPGVHRVRDFVEKPDAARALAYVAGGDHLWNAGIFVFRADVMLAAIETHMPALAEGLRALDAAALRGDETAELDRSYASLPSVSIDVGVMERVGGVTVVPVDCGWSDVGSWQAAWELGTRDERDNVLRVDPERAVIIDASGNMIVAPPGKTIAIIGVDDLVVVDTPDALLIVPRSRAQDVKKAVDALASRGAKEI
ncbi:MAG: sugar phosphate nucleotidyltransferase, partial [Deltaproteobacteria bacterium]